MTATAQRGREHHSRIAAPEQCRVSPDERVDRHTDPGPDGAEDWGNDDVRGPGGIAATEECSRIAVGVLFCDDCKQAVDGARYEPDQRAVGESVVRTVDPEDRRVRDVTALTILRQEHQVVGREVLDAALPLPSLIVGDSHLLAFLDTLPDRIGVPRAGRLSSGRVLLSRND